MLPSFNPFDALSKLSGLMSAKAYAEVQPIIADFMQKFTALHRDNELLTEENAVLKKQVAQSKDFRAKAKKYRTNNEDSGVVTCVLRAPADEQEKTHRFCTRCYSNSQIRHLQPTTKTTGWMDHPLNPGARGCFRVHECHECSSSYEFGFIPAKPRAAYGGGTGGGRDWMTS